MKVAISGFGRIGKMFLRAAVAQGVLGKEFDIIAINTRSPVETHAHLFKYDSAMGRFNGKVEIKEGDLVVNDYRIKWITETDPLKLPWKELDIDVVVESTGKFTHRDEAERHIKAGAKKVVISAPTKDEVDATIVPGVNDHILDSNMKLISLASCTTNGLAPALKVIDEKWGIERGFLSTIHAYTNDQMILDSSHKDLRRARAAATNIIPTSTGAAKAIGHVLPNLKGKLDGGAFRVPVIDGSINDIVLVLKSEVDAKDINKELKRASREELKGIMDYTEEEIVSSDIIGTPFSCTVDASLTRSNGNLVKINLWYDNEYGYSNRLVDLIKKLAKM